ncbi:MAG: segregation and condensation protein A [Anaerovoracaceae bacterium]
MAYKVKLNTFEGPFDLLVYLIESARMNIYDIKISDITRQYLDYIEVMKDLDVNVASEFMVLAASLIDIKSKMLLPRKVTEEGEIVAEDPRTELVQKLLEYKKFKNAAEILMSKEEESLHIYSKPQEDLAPFTGEVDESLSLTVEQFMKAFDGFINKKKKQSELQRDFQRKEENRVSAESRINFFIDEVFQYGSVKSASFFDSVPDKKDKYDYALSFSSVLEMMRQRRITGEQKKVFADIILSPTENLMTGVEVEKIDE